MNRLAHLVILLVSGWVFGGCASPKKSRIEPPAPVSSGLVAEQSTDLVYYLFGNEGFIWREGSWTNLKSGEVIKAGDNIWIPPQKAEAIALIPQAEGSNESEEWMSAVRRKILQGNYLALSGQAHLVWERFAHDPHAHTYTAELYLASGRLSVQMGKRGSIKIRYPHGSVTARSDNEPLKFSMYAEGALSLISGELEAVRLGETRKVQTNTILPPVFPDRPGLKCEIHGELMHVTKVPIHDGLILYSPYYHDHRKKAFPNDGRRAGGGVIYSDLPIHSWAYVCQQCKAISARTDLDWTPVFIPEFPKRIF